MKRLFFICMSIMYLSLTAGQGTSCCPEQSDADAPASHSAQLTETSIGLRVKVELYHTQTKQLESFDQEDYEHDSETHTFTKIEKERPLYSDMVGRTHIMISTTEFIEKDQKALVTFFVRRGFTHLEEHASVPFYNRSQPYDCDKGTKYFQVSIEKLTAAMLEPKDSK